MSAVIRFRPLIGGRDETPLCYLLEIDEFKILLDCGWEDSFDLKLLDNLKVFLRLFCFFLCLFPLSLSFVSFFLSLIFSFYSLIRRLPQQSTPF